MHRLGNVIGSKQIGNMVVFTCRDNDGDEGDTLQIALTFPTVEIAAIVAGMTSPMVLAESLDRAQDRANGVDVTPDRGLPQFFALSA